VSVYSAWHRLYDQADLATLTLAHVAGVLVLADPLRITFPLMAIGRVDSHRGSGVTGQWSLFHRSPDCFPLAAEKWAFRKVRF